MTFPDEILKVATYWPDQDRHPICDDNPDLKLFAVAFTKWLEIGVTTQMWESIAPMLRCMIEAVYTAGYQRGQADAKEAR